MTVLSPAYLTTQLDPGTVHERVAAHLLADGFEFVLDLDRSHGSTLVDARDSSEYLDMFTFFASSALGMNHDALARDDEFLREIAAVAVNKPSNSDVYTVPMARFVETFARVLGDKALPHLFFIDGGALAVENALKIAFDWKSRLNESRGIDPALGTKVLHLERAFHGRSGYTMSLTNTEPVKVARFPKFDWPRIPSPAVNLHDDEAAVAAAEAEAIEAARRAFEENPHDIACFIAEPIQGEGGDNHFRPSFLRAMQALCREFDALFVLDEVQTGVGLTGTAWAYQQLGLEPDVVAFGKKTQVCGVMAGGRVDEVGRQRLHRLIAHQLDLGRQPHRHGPGQAHPRGDRGRAAHRARRDAGGAPARRAARPRRAAPRARLASPRPRPHVRDHPPERAPARRGHHAPARGRTRDHARLRRGEPAVPSGARPFARKNSTACSPPSTGSWRRRQ